MLIQAINNAFRAIGLHLFDLTGRIAALESNQGGNSTSFIAVFNPTGDYKIIGGGGWKTIPPNEAVSPDTPAIKKTVTGFEILQAGRWLFEAEMRFAANVPDALDALLPGEWKAGGAGLDGFHTSPGFSLKFPTLGNPLQAGAWVANLRAGATVELCLKNENDRFHYLNQVILDQVVFKVTRL